MNKLTHYIQTTDSTINHLKRMLTQTPTLDNCYTIYTFFQTAGRGQAGNSWESEDGKNLLFSTLLKPQHLAANQQFRLSMLVSLVVLNAIEKLLKVYNVELKTILSIKWPNDIYAADKKLVGILIENTLSNGFVNTSIAGVGINVNQTRFLSGAPNPVSLKQLTEREFDLHLFVEIVQKELQTLLPLLNEPTKLKQLYIVRLYRASGYHPYVECEVSASPIRILQDNNQHQFLAKIHDIDDNGCLQLILEDNSIRSYHFKQIRFIIHQ